MSRKSINKSMSKFRQLEAEAEREIDNEFGDLLTKKQKKALVLHHLQKKINKLVGGV